MADPLGSLHIHKYVCDCHGVPVQPLLTACECEKLAGLKSGSIDMVTLLCAALVLAGAACAYDRWPAPQHSSQDGRARAPDWRGYSGVHAATKYNTLKNVAMDQLLLGSSARQDERVRLTEVIQVRE